MAFFADDELGKIAIKRMVFHLVGPKDNALVKLQEVEPGKFTDFFVERIRSVNFGVGYKFSDASSTRERLRRIQEDGKVFQEETEKLAEDFQRRHKGSAATGAILLFVLDVAGKAAFALLKYDDEQVLAYDVEEGPDGVKRVSLASLERTFVQNKEALQKSALVRLTEGGGELTVLDRRNQQKVARYFEDFLDAIREFDDADLSMKIVDVTRRVIKDNPDLVSPEVYSQLTKRTFEAVKGGGTIGGEDQQAFLDTVVGAKLPEDHPLVKKYKQGLRNARIDGMPVNLSPEKVKDARIVKYRTARGIEVKIPADVKALVEVTEDGIVIHDKLQRTFDDTE